VKGWQPQTMFEPVVGGRGRPSIFEGHTPFENFGYRVCAIVVGTVHGPGRLSATLALEYH
jgi:hypothetical protein